MELLIGFVFFLTSVLFAFCVIAWLTVLSGRALFLQFWPVLLLVGSVAVLKKLLGRPSSES